MGVSSAEATWKGPLKTGRGTMKLPRGNYEGPYSYPSRFGPEAGTSPEELLGSAHAGCFSMALAGGLEAAGHPAETIHTTAKVYLEQVGKAYEIRRIDLSTEVTAPGLDDATLQEVAKKKKAECPVSKLFNAAEINLDARLK